MLINVGNRTIISKGNFKFFLLTNYFKESNCYLFLLLLEPGKTKVLFVKNLSFDTTIDSLQAAFDGATTARIATDRDTGKSKG